MSEEANRIVWNFLQLPEEEQLDLVDKLCELVKLETIDPERLEMLEECFHNRTG
jgi:hypothetical protein